MNELKTKLYFNNQEIPHFVRNDKIDFVKGGRNGDSPGECVI